MLGVREAPGGILGSLGSPRGYASVSDTLVREVTLDKVLEAQAYMLFMSGLCRLRQSRCGLVYSVISSRDMMWLVTVCIVFVILLQLVINTRFSCC